MKRIGHLFEELVSFPNLLKAAKKARQGCGKTQESCRFFYYLETEILALQRSLFSGDYRPGSYRYFTVYDPKERSIAVAPFRDRVVHHALVLVLTPVFEPCFIFDSYATRPGKGTHAAIQRAQTFLRKKFWFLKADIHKFFDSVDHDIMISILKRKIKDQKLLDLLELIVRNTEIPGVGLPIGNLTSQFLANVYLNPFDHQIKDHYRIKHFIRYMDDFVLFADSKQFLLDMWEVAGNILQERLALKLKQGGVWLNHSGHGLSFLGHCIYPGMIRVRGKNLRRSLKRLQSKQKSRDKGYIHEEHLVKSLSSSIGQLRNFNPQLPIGVWV
ncbi:hypothetical protein AKJ60_00845 [candidate division MSBL1 archaeon SCGC-AAA385M11]|nr:hypothetical protein AKJ60_00845 [candidate division MSBL1 archaeon SCGC-AAA385M11]